MLGFDVALPALLAGRRITRMGWNAPGQFVYFVPAASYPAQTGVAKEYFGEDALVPYRAYFALKTASNDVAIWTPSTSDCIERDWIIL